MNPSSLSGKKVILETSRTECRVGELLGSGGQGEVYQVEIGGKLLALKWYYAHAASRAQHEALEALIRSGPPGAAFLWPLDLASLPGTERFGYIMPLREKRFSNIVDLMKRRVEPSFAVLLAACRSLAAEYLALHARGWCYRDISFGNVFFDGASGEILICDNDNVAVNRASGRAGVLGTPKFMAPEIVRGESEPDTQTDLYSLAVLLFYLLMVHHPLDGKRVLSVRCMDLPAMNRLYGSDPLFVFDPRDDSNAPDPQEQANPLAFWPIYPGSLRSLFVRAFTEGIADPQRRVRESEWRNAIQDTLDVLHPCPVCGMENFYDAETQAADSGETRCWGCAQPLPAPLILQIGNRSVCLNADTRLFARHLVPQPGDEDGAPLAKVARHPDRPDLWGLKNLGETSWSIRSLDGSPKEVPPGRSFSLAPGVSVHFGALEGRIIHPGR